MGTAPTPVGAVPADDACTAHDVVVGVTSVPLDHCCDATHSSTYRDEGDRLFAAVGVPMPRGVSGEFVVFKEEATIHLPHAGNYVIRAKNYASVSRVPR